MRARSFCLLTLAKPPPLPIRTRTDDMQSSNFHDVSTEMKHAIACVCSPLDLVNFSRINTECRRIVFSADLFRRSIVKIGGPTLDLPASLIPGVITFFFGISLCWTCGKQTDTYPLSFSLCIRVCNEQCKEDLYRRSPNSADKFATIPSRAELKDDGVLLEYIEPWAPFLERPVNGRKVYSSYQLRAAISLLSNTMKVGASENAGERGPNARSLLLEEWSQRASDLPVLQTCANRMIAWRKTYEKDRKKCSASNDRTHPEEFPEARKMLLASPSESFCPACRLSIKKYGAEGLAMHNAAKHQ
ncbi:hypothetical protein B0H17DRAFT_1212253 [Mycena rosella]|uniref:F-box domain-containing protein n=1 Tax=Mycena rosella TaxID=1033263 RepID=A0AAD7CST2_MYCRO|nr:hypothetical protein B0H17DRAFT_1212253 [Mycena rosella]